MTDNAKQSGGGSAHASLDGAEVTHWLLSSGYGFDVPLRSRVTGVVVTVVRSSDSAGEVADEAAAIMVDGNPRSSRVTSGTWPTSTRPVSYGAPTDRWDTLLTSEVVNSPGFGFALAARGVDSLLASAAVDGITMAVHFERCR